MIAARLLIDDLTKFNHVMAPPAQTILRAQIRRVHPRNSAFMTHLVMASSAVTVEISPVAATMEHVAMPNSVFNLRETQITPVQNFNCSNCGRTQHSNPLLCPATNRICTLCSKRGHFASVCHSASRGRIVRGVYTSNRGNS